MIDLEQRMAERADDLAHSLEDWWRTMPAEIPIGIVPWLAFRAGYMAAMVDGGLTALVPVSRKSPMR